MVFGIGPENSSSSRRVRPFVKIPDVEIGTEIVQVKVDLPWGVSTIDYADYIAFLAFRLKFDKKKSGENISKIRVPLSTEIAWTS